MRDGALGLHRPGRRPDRRPDGPPDGRPRRDVAVPQAGRRRRARCVLEVRGLTRARRLQRRQLRRSAAARSSRSPGWSAPGAARSCGRCSASTATTPARCASPASRCAAARPRGRDGRRARAGARGPPPAGPGHGAVDRAQRDARPALALSRLGLLLGRRRARAARRVDEAPAGQGRPALPTRSARCPAATSRRSCWPSGWPPARGCSSSTSRPAASTSAPRPRCTG